MGILHRSEFVLCQVKPKKPKFLLRVAVQKPIKAENAQASQTATCLDAAMPVGIVLHTMLTPAHIVQAVKRQ